MHGAKVKTLYSSLFSNTELISVEFSVCLKDNVSDPENIWSQWNVNAA
jgi:hypothetical protein